MGNFNTIYSEVEQSVEAIRMCIGDVSANSAEVQEDKEREGDHLDSVIAAVRDLKLDHESRDDYVDPRRRSSILTYQGRRLRAAIALCPPLANYRCHGRHSNSSLSSPAFLDDAGKDINVTAAMCCAAAGLDVTLMALVKSGADLELRCFRGW